MTENTVDGSAKIAVKHSAARAAPKLQGVSRALRVLDVIAEQPMKASEIADRLELPWATCYRALSQLEQDQFIERSASGEYRIGPHTWLLGSTYLVGHPVLDLAVPLLNAASTELPAAVFQLAERSGDISLVLYSHEPQEGETITRADFGHHFPLHAGSKGWVLLANEPDEFVDRYLAGPLLPLTPDTITDPELLREELRAVRAQGYAVTSSDVQGFTGSVAAPVFDSSGAVTAAVCAIMMRSYLSDKDHEQRALESVLRVSRALSFSAGWQPVRAAQEAQSPRAARRRPGRPSTAS